MAKIVSKRVLEEIRYRSDVADVIGAYITLQRAGVNFKALCPFHKEKTPSFTVNTQRQSFHCFGCGVGGDVFAFVMQREGVDFTTAVRMLAERANVPVELDEDDGAATDKTALFKIHEGVAQFYRRCLLQVSAAAHARRYLESRGLGETTAEDFIIGYAPNRWDALVQWAAKHNHPPELMELAGLILKNDRPNARASHFDRFRNRLMFPIRDEQSRVIGFSGRALDDKAQAAKYINSPETPLFKKSRILYAIDRARRAIPDAGEAIVCEGQIDVIRCHAAGFANAVAAQGTAFTDDHARIIRRYADSVVLVFDPDVAGQDAAIRAAGVFLRAGLAVRIGTLPPGQDPDVLIRDHGADAFRKVLEDAASAVAFQIAVLSGRENAGSEVGAMRISRAVLQTIMQTPSAVLRARLVQEGARTLGIPESALMDDLRFQETRGRRPEAPLPAEPPVEPAATRTREEVELCEHLARVADAPELADIVERYLPLTLLRDPVCRRVAEACLQAAERGEPVYGLLEADVDVNADLLRFAEAVQSAPSKIRGTEVTRADAVRDICLRLWRRELRARRQALARELKAGASRDLQARYNQITLDLDSLKNWDEGAAIIEMEMTE